MTFRIKGLAAEQFSHLFGLSDAALRAQDAARVVANGRGYPCRVSLTDARPGDELILLHYEHHAVASPYRSSYAIYVRPGEEMFDRVAHVPHQLQTRLLAVRAFDARGWLLNCDVTEGEALEACIERLFDATAVAYLHVHFAKAGCYAACVERA
jgi:Protein of unknown function (DUF1203)